MRTKVDEATALLFNEREIAQKIIEDARQLMTPVRDSVHDAELIKALNDEVERLKVGYFFTFSRSISHTCYLRLISGNRILECRICRKRIRKEGMNTRGGITSYRFHYKGNVRSCKKPKGESINSRIT